jgi:hypothetical protein
MAISAVKVRYLFAGNLTITGVGQQSSADRKLRVQSNKTH